MEDFVLNESVGAPVTAPMTLQMGGVKGGLRSQTKPVGSYVYEKLTNIVSYDEKTAYQLLENTQYILLTVIVCYLYSNIVNNLLPYKKSFSKEKRLLDLALHLVALSIGFFLLPKLVQVVPSIMHSSTSFTSYETDAYSGIFVPLFLVSFNYSALSKKIGGIGKETITIPILQDNQPKKEVRFVKDETLRPKQQSKAQILPTPRQKYPTTSNLPTVSSMNHQQIEATQMGGFGRPQSTRTPEVKEGSDIRDFLSKVQDDENAGSHPLVQDLTQGRGAETSYHGDLSTRQNDPAEMQRRALRPSNDGFGHSPSSQIPSGDIMPMAGGGGGSLAFAPF